MSRIFFIFFRDAVNKGFLLIAATLFGLILSNSHFSSVYHNILHAEFKISHESLNIGIPMHFFVNDFMMSIFFFIVGIEIKREMISGHLANKSQRILPVICGIFGVITPMIFYTYINLNLQNNLNGWAIPTATDIAFTVAVMSVFSNKIPQSIRVFVTALAIIDDLIAVIAIALFYTEALHFEFLIGILICIALLCLLNLKSIQNTSPYILIGIGMFLCFYFSGIHATVSGVVLGFCIPQSVSEKFEHYLQKFVTYLIMPTFAFFNSGIELSDGIDFLHPITLGIFIGLFLGKQIGIFGSFFLLIKLRVAAMPANANFYHAYVAAILCGIGFTMSLFVASLAFEHDSSELLASKLGIVLGSLASCVFGATLLRFSFKAKE